jgi:hypothetical protein
VRKGVNIAKFWLLPDVRLASAWGMNPKELNILEKIIVKNKDIILEKWNENINKRCSR